MNASKMAGQWLIRGLQPADQAQYRALRLEALAAHPEAFGKSPEEELAEPTPLVPDPPGIALGAFATGPLAGSPAAERLLGPIAAERLLGPIAAERLLGPIAAERLVGSIAMFVSPRLKQRHKGHVAAVYVAPGWRRTGLSRDLLGALIRHARDAGLVSLTLSVTAGNEPARRLYLDAGFRRYGMEPASLCVGDRLLDEELMALMLSAHTD